jgi:hypothetical protein
MKIETEFETRKEQRATTRDLFHVCRRCFSGPVAIVAAELLFWSQYGQYKLRGRAGFFKEDADLVEAIGKAASSIRRALSPICAKVNEDRPEALFEIDHGPKPGQRSGRVRWLFRKPRGDELVKEALLLAKAREEKRQRSSANRSRKSQLVGRDWSHRSAQNERTPYIQMDSSETHSESLSSKQCGREKTKSFGKEDERKEKLRSESLKEKNGDDSDNRDKKGNEMEELTRLVNCWNAICSECNEPTLAWLESNVSRHASRLVEVIQRLGITKMPDEELSKRLRLLCGNRSRPVFARIGSRFSEYNSDGLLIQTFAMHGPRVWRAVEAELSEGALKPRPAELPVRPREKPLTSEEKAHALEQLTEAWNKACEERGVPSARWSREAVDKRSRDLLRIILATRLHRIPDQQLRARLGIIVDYLARNSIVMEHDLGALLLKGFSVYGKEWLAQTLDEGTNNSDPASGDDKVAQDTPNEDAACS